MQIAIVGQGYVGLPLAMAAAQAGHTVRGIDLNKNLVSALNKGQSPIGDISNAAISASLESGK